MTYSPPISWVFTWFCSFFNLMCRCYLLVLNEQLLCCISKLRKWVLCHPCTDIHKSSFIYLSYDIADTIKQQQWCAPDSAAMLSLLRKASKQQMHPDVRVIFGKYLLLAEIKSQSGTLTKSALKPEHLRRRDQENERCKHFRPSL